MSVSQTIVLPGDEIAPADLPKPQNQKKALTLGPGLRHIPPSTITTAIAGALVTDNRKNAAWVEYNSGRYLPALNDLVIATVNTSSGEAFNCFITPNTPLATLPHLAFEGATKKTRPQLSSNAIVYARVANTGKDSIPELTCVDASGKSDGLGPLKGGMVFKISLGMARRLLAGKKKGGVIVLEGLSEKVGFEVAVGRNGVLWVDGGNVKTTLAVGKAIQEVDEQALGEKGQKKVVERVLKTL